jgi:hypothetical protein
MICTAARAAATRCARVRVREPGVKMILSTTTSKKLPRREW